MDGHWRIITMYDTSEKGERQFKRVEYLLWGLYIFIPFMFLNPWFGI